MKVLHGQIQQLNRTDTAVLREHGIMRNFVNARPISNTLECIGVAHRKWLIKLDIRLNEGHIQINSAVAALRGKEGMRRRLHASLKVISVPIKCAAGQSVDIELNHIRQAKVHGHNAVATLQRSESMLIVSLLKAMVFLPKNGLTRNNALLARLWWDNG